MPLRLKASFIIQPFSIFYVPPYKAFFMHFPCLFSLFLEPLSALETERNNEKNNLHSSIKSINFLHVWAAAALLVLLFLLFPLPLLLLAKFKTLSYFCLTFLMMLSWCDNVEYLLVREVAPGMQWFLSMLIKILTSKSEAYLYQFIEISATIEWIHQKDTRSHL